MTNIKREGADLDKLDREIRKRVHRISSGTASASDVSEATCLMRERANLMMPGVFERLRKEGVLKKSSTVWEGKNE